MDTMLIDSVEGGARQFVNLGAGLDSRAYRFRERLRGVKVFELDFPPTLEHKKKRVREILGARPEHVVYVPIDFTKDDLGTVLRRAGYQPGSKTFFLWEGVAPYLTEDGVSATLRFVAQNSAPGSVIAFDYVTRGALASEDPARQEARVKRGEPFLFGFPDGRTAAYLAEQGLRTIVNLGPAEITTRFLTKADGSVLGGADDSWYCVAAVPEKSVDPEESGNDATAILKLQQDIVKAFNEQDLDRLMSYHHVDVMYLVPNQLPIAGHKAVRAMYESGFNSRKERKVIARLEVVTAEVIASGDWAWARGQARTIVTTQDGVSKPSTGWSKHLSIYLDPFLALKTRRATGYYKVPSLKGVWYRGPFEHHGSVMTLEDWLNPDRVRDDYVPTGYRGLTKTRAVRGHEFGLKLNAGDKKALIAFLNTL
jgi:methyltransferase (TIGR00027 family)